MNELHEEQIIVDEQVIETLPEVKQDADDAPAEEISTSMYEVALANELTSDVNVTVIFDETTSSIN